MEPTKKSIDPQSALVETPGKESTATDTNTAAAKPKAVKPKAAKSNAAKGSTTAAKCAAAAAAKAVDIQSAGEPEAKPKASGVQRIRLMIASDTTPEGKCDVPVSDGQGGQYLIKRDEEVEVPIGVYNVLRCANQDVYQTDANDSVTGHRSVPRFNIMVLG